MPFFLRKENERLSTFMHTALWRQQLFMHMRVHFFIFVRTMLWVRDSVRAWCVHSPKQLRKLPGAVHFPMCTRQDFFYGFLQLDVATVPQMSLKNSRNVDDTALWL